MLKKQVNKIIFLRILLVVGGVGGLLLGRGGGIRNFTKKMNEHYFITVV